MVNVNKFTDFEREVHYDIVDYVSYKYGSEWLWFLDHPEDYNKMAHEFWLTKGVG